ncbi:MAG: hypothetical protein A3H42_02510 [Deltaproteobacteria bacterium RIFCSPLOWO2_02_FULL_46_8]|nr:MAG: hypothetical protein A3H42_02510 [Deltaproteobacteria bacterium RIFCSPLOWO2_02_FULL_46_8]
MWRFIFACLLFLPSLLSAGASSDPFSRGGVEMVSLQRDGERIVVYPHNSEVWGNSADISGDGRYIAFTQIGYFMDAEGQVRDQHCKLFRYDRLQKKTETIGFFDCTENTLPSISGDGRKIAVESLEPGGLGIRIFTDYYDTNYTSPISVNYRDLVSEDFVEAIRRSGRPFSESLLFRPSISADGNYIAFESVKNGRRYIDVVDLIQFGIERISGAAEPDGDSESPSISGDGRYVAFASTASNLVSGGPGGHKEIFIHDRQNHTTERISVGVNGERPNGDSNSPAISVSGRFVAFQSDASNLDSHGDNPGTNIFVYDRERHTTQRASDWRGENNALNCRHPAIAESWIVVFQCAPDGRHFNIFVHDLRLHTTQSIITGYEDKGTNPSISGNAQFIAFQSPANNLVPGDADNESDIFVASVTTTHLECRNHACTPVTGPPMPDLCVQGRNDCGEQPSSAKKKSGNIKDIFSKSIYHLECLNQACVSVKGRGPNKCKKDIECRAVKKRPPQ